MLGEARPAEAGCPADCLVEARVTGFQASIDGRKRPFSVPGKGRIVALTIPTWSPSFAVGARKSSGWRASRVATESRGDCSLDDGLANVDAGAPHVKRRTQRSYGCRYRSSRLLYSARFVAGAKGAK